MTQIDALPLARFDFDAAKALRAACSTDESRPILHNVLVRDTMAEATNGHTLVRVPLLDPNGEEFAMPDDCQGNRWLLPGAALAHVKSGTFLEIDMRSGECWVVASEEKEGYPIELPQAQVEVEGLKYPDTDAVIPKTNGEYRRLWLGAPVIKAMVAFAGTGKEAGSLFLLVPPEQESEEGVATAIPFERRGARPRSGLVMPMRVIGMEEDPAA